MSNLVARVTAVSAALLAGCSDFVAGCPSDLRSSVSPSERTVHVGESFTATAAALGCGGSKRLDEWWVWSSQDTRVARVDSLSGRITGRAPGTIYVVASGRQWGMVTGTKVTVR